MHTPSTDAHPLRTRFARFHSLPLFATSLFAVGPLSAQTTYSTDTEITSSTTVTGFRVNNGATLTVSDGGTLNATGAASTVGNGGGNGNLIISAGGVVNTASTTLGSNPGFTGTVTVTGAGASWSNSGSLLVGTFGSGNLTVSNGGYLHTGSLSASGIATSTIGISGPGAAVEIDNHLTLAGGSLTVTNGVTVSVATGTFGLNNGGTATFTGSGTHLIFNGTQFNVGNSGVGSLIVGDGAIATVNGGSGNIVVGTNSGSAGTLNVGASSASPAATAGILNAASIATGAGNGTLQFNTTGTNAAPTYFTKDGTATGAAVATGGAIKLVHTAGYTVFTGDLAHTGDTVLNGGTARFHGTVESTVTVNSGATLGVSSPGTLTFAGGLTLADGSSLDFQLGTVSDLILLSGGVLTGSDSLGGITLNLLDAGDFTAADYVLFDFTGGTTSNFDVDRFIFGDTIEGYDYALQLSGSTLSLHVTASVVPEPATTGALAGALALGLTAWLKRRRT